LVSGPFFGRTFEGITLGSSESSELELELELDDELDS